MSTEHATNEAPDWILSATNRALGFLAALASEETNADDRMAAWEQLGEEIGDDPAKQHTILYSLVWLAHCMRTSAAGDTDPGYWTFELHTPFGRMPIDQAKPSIRWVSRWLIACMNGDAGAAADLWFGTPASKEEAEECMQVLVGPLLAFLTGSVREFLRAGKPLVIPGGESR